MSTRYRIIRRPSCVNPAMPIYQVERRVLWWWEDAGCFLSLKAAKGQIHELRQADANPIKREVIHQEP